MNQAENKFIIWHDDSNMPSLEEEAKYPLTEEQERHLKEIVEEVFHEFGLADEPPEMPTDPLNVAKYILEKQGKMTTWKLQKLCYYAQAWHYTWTGKRLIQDEIQAWRWGPVFPTLFHAHARGFEVEAKDFKTADSTKLSTDAKDSIDVMLEHYGELTPDELVELTHSEDPWKIARGDTPSTENSDAVITLESMGEYYRKHLI